LSSGLEKVVKHVIMAKRSARMVVAICSSHASHPKFWQRMLTVLEGKLTAAWRTEQGFVKLTLADRQAVLVQQGMEMYCVAVERLAEVGIWVAGTTMEAMVYEKEAEKVWRLAQEVLKGMQSCYQRPVHPVRER